MTGRQDIMILLLRPRMEPLAARLPYLTLDTPMQIPLSPSPGRLTGANSRFYSAGEPWLNLALLEMPQLLLTLSPRIGLKLYHEVSRKAKIEGEGSCPACEVSR